MLSKQDLYLVATENFRLSLSEGRKLLLPCSLRKKGDMFLCLLYVALFSPYIHERRNSKYVQIQTQRERKSCSFKTTLLVAFFHLSSQLYSLLRLDPSLESLPPFFVLLDYLFLLKLQIKCLASSFSRLSLLK